MKSTTVETIGQQVLKKIRDGMSRRKVTAEQIAAKVSTEERLVSADEVKTALAEGHNSVDAVVQMYWAMGTTASLGLSTVEYCSLPLDRALARNFAFAIKTLDIDDALLVTQATVAGNAQTDNHFYYAILSGDCMDINIIRAAALALKPEHSLAHIIATCEAKMLILAA